MIYRSISEFLAAKSKWEAAPMKIINGKGFVFVKGRKYPFEEYVANNPKPTYEPPPRCNPDGTCIPAGVYIKRHNGYNPDKPSCQPQSFTFPI